MPFKKLSTQLILLVIVLITIAASHIQWIKDDLGVLLTVDNRPIDVIGILRNHFTLASRNCETVERVSPSQGIYKTVQRLIDDYSPPDSRQAKLASVWSMGSWVLVEVEFKELLPAVVLIQNTDTAPSILAEGIWSGYTNPHKSAPFIRNYLTLHVDAVPAPLINCFDPQSEPFK